MDENLGILLFTIDFNLLPNQMIYLNVLRFNVLSLPLALVRW